MGRKMMTREQIEIAIEELEKVKKEKKLFITHQMFNEGQLFAYREVLRLERP